MDKILLVAGCSHAAGSEIDGTEDSKYNRSQSFGNQLADLMNRKAINIAQTGATNASIARSVVEWFDKNYIEGMDVFVLASWTESTRIEVPADRITWYEVSNPGIDWFDEKCRLFYRINMGYEGYGDEEKRIYSYFQKFIIENTSFIEIMTANIVLQLQYFLKMHNIRYVMCNTMHMFTLPNQHLEVYTPLLDRSKYYRWDDNENSFFWKYRNAGYVNPKAKYWHHDETPHKLFAEELYRFIGEQ